ncbi:MAG: hypothetical protein ABI255_05585 [Microbacteriaceae bacterium]
MRAIRLWCAVGILSLGLSLAGCGGTSPAPQVTSNAVPTSTPGATPIPDPVLQPSLSAKENLGYFDFVNKRLIAANPNADGRAFVDALVAAGFAKADMQLTVDKTTVNLVANSIQFSVKFNGACLIGQSGPDSGGYHGEATSLLSTGACLVGQTRPIDW